eukprot:TRINITY_DN475_c0_g2_i1.p1 TRINITY_DN475_c0_g2~~TRINITY_DN475_c0_g2_i1.p1  ORF type:complete len:117 (-),score=61.22 TRINITY_DN475_c0_g2_i1:54-404(-)
MEENEGENEESLKRRREGESITEESNEEQESGKEEEEGEEPGKRTKSSQFHPLEEHRFFCPWINQKSKGGWLSFLEAVISNQEKSDGEESKEEQRDPSITNPLLFVQNAMSGNPLH